MSLSVVFTDDATEMLLLITGHIENRWSKKEAEKFLKKACKTINLVAGNPYMFKASVLKHDIRIGFISKQTSFFYKVQDTEIIILFFWDNRQEPLFNPES